MVSWLFHILVYNPFYNGLIFLLGIIPGGDLGVAIILLTIVVKIILLPLSFKDARTKLKMQVVMPELEKIKERYKDNKAEQAQKMMELYKTHQLNPLSGFVNILIQLPLLIALFSVFSSGGLPMINQALLYSFINSPDKVSLLFLGLIDISSKSLILAVLAGLAQYIQLRIILPPTPPIKPDSKNNPSFKDDFARSMNLQMRYVMPGLIAVFAYAKGAIALYFIASSVLGAIQELYIRKRLEAQK